MINAKPGVFEVARAEKGLTQTELAKNAGLSSGIVFKIEHGKNLSARSAKKLADALDKTVCELFSFTPAVPATAANTQREEV
ncbi:MAG: helix-turn-helix transcriptional regulator [Oscillospiraceae bacterium]